MSVTVAGQMLSSYLRDNVLELVREKCMPVVVSQFIENAMGRLSEENLVKLEKMRGLLESLMEILLVLVVVALSHVVLCTWKGWRARGRSAGTFPRRAESQLQPSGAPSSDAPPGGLDTSMRSAECMVVAAKQDWFRMSSSRFFVMTTTTSATVVDALEVGHDRTGSSSSGGTAGGGLIPTLEFGEAGENIVATIHKLTHPSGLSYSRIGRGAALNDKYTVRFVGNSTDRASVLADMPAPPSSLVYYFEITVLEEGTESAIGLGFAPSSHILTHHVGWDAGTYGFHGDDGNTFLEGTAKFYGFTFRKGDVVGAALDFQRKEIFFTKNGIKGVALPVAINNKVLYPAVSLGRLGQVVSVNFGQKPFTFNVRPYKMQVGSKVVIRRTSVGAAKALQVGHGGWGSSMDKMLGKTGVVTGIDKDGDVRVKMDDGGGTLRWNPVLVEPSAAALSPFRVGAKVSIKACLVSEAKVLQRGHGGWADAMETMLGMPGVVESIDKDGDVTVRMHASEDAALWNPSLVLPGVLMPTASLFVGGKAYIKNVSVEAAARMQEGHGGWSSVMGKYLGKAGTVSYKYTDGDVRIKFDDDFDFCWYWGLVLPGAEASASAAPPSTVDTGPFGPPPRALGSSFGAFDDTRLSQGGEAPITAIRVRSGHWIDAIQVRYGSTWGPLHGGMGGAFRPALELQPGEHIVAVRQVRYKDYINGITVQTSSGRVQNFGGDNEQLWRQNGWHEHVVAGARATPPSSRTPRLVAVKGNANQYLESITFVWG